MRILVVEDNQIARMAYKTFLEAGNFTVDFAEDGEKGIEIAKAKYDIILMDVNMPNLNGIEATLRIRQDEKEYGKPIIIGITGSIHQDRLRECRDAGMDEVMGKPASVDEIIKIIKKHMRKEEV